MITPSFFFKQPSDRNGFSWGLNRTENVDQEDESQRKIPELPLKEDHITVYERFVGDIKRSSWGGLAKVGAQMCDVQLEV